MQRLPLVTILLPLKAYHPGFLATALESVIQQTSSHWRALVIVDHAERASFIASATACPPIRSGARSDGR